MRLLHLQNQKLICQIQVSFKVVAKVLKNLKSKSCKELYIKIQKKVQILKAVVKINLKYKSCKELYIKIQKRVQILKVVVKKNLIILWRNLRVNQIKAKTKFRNNLRVVKINRKYKSYKELYIKIQKKVQILKAVVKNKKRLNKKQVKNNL